MKSVLCSAIVSAAMFALPAQASKLIAKCSNDETQLTLREVSNNNYSVTIVTESLGGSAPEFRYKNLVLVPPPPHRKDSPMVYQGKGITLEIKVTVDNEPAVLNVPDIGLENEELTCR